MKTLTEEEINKMHKETFPEKYMKCTQQKHTMTTGRGEQVMTDCGGEMEEVGETDKHVQSAIVLGDGKTYYSNTPVKLYQCNVCKTIKLV